VAEVAQTNLQLYNQLVALAWPAEDLVRVRAAYELTTQLFSGRYRCSGKSFVAHLVGTASLVADVDGRVDLVLAALLHAAYEAGDFGTGLHATQAAKRSTVRSVVGPAAEALVFEYLSFKWGRDALAQAVADPAAPDPIRRNVVLLRLANEVDEHADLGTHYCDKGDADIYSENALQAMAELADRLEYPKLAVAFRHVLDAERGVTVPAELQSSERGSMVRVSASYAPRASVSARMMAWRGRRLIASVPGVRPTVQLLRKLQEKFAPESRGR